MLHDLTAKKHKLFGMIKLRFNGLSKRRKRRDDKHTSCYKSLLILGTQHLHIVWRQPVVRVVEKHHPRAFWSTLHPKLHI